MEVEVECLRHGYRPIHLWDEATLLFSFDSRASTPMYWALENTLRDPNRKSVYAMTSSTSQVLLRIFADRPGPGKSVNVHRIVIPTPHPEYNRESVEIAAQQALDLFFNEHKVDTFTLADIKAHWTDKDDVITPAIAIEVARTLPFCNFRVDQAVAALQRTMDDVRSNFRHFVTSYV